MYVCMYVAQALKLMNICVCILECMHISMYVLRKYDA